MRMIAIAVTVLVAMAASALAQDNAEQHSKHHKLREWVNALSPEQQAKLHAVRKQALQNAEVRRADEQRKKADAKYRELLHREMLRIDPELKPLLDKISELRQRADY
jgi:hypothetical protein